MRSYNKSARDLVNEDYRVESIVRQTLFRNTRNIFYQRKIEIYELIFIFKIISVMILLWTFVLQHHLDLDFYEEKKRKKSKRVSANLKIQFSLEHMAQEA